MDLGEYFDSAKGHGILATADADGKVNAAMYARPYLTDDKTALFIMAERLTHANVQTNPWATYLFIESGHGYKGKRLYLKKLKEEQNNELLGKICRKCDYSHYDVGNKYIVSFNLERVLPLIGDK
ncbi:MAG TPA: pyridoxamine 5'-phosphate oxidase family protein [Dehalococcoidia bacterium]|jgi:hypothetical protein